MMDAGKSLGGLKVEVCWNFLGVLVFHRMRVQSSGRSMRMDWLKVRYSNGVFQRHKLLVRPLLFRFSSRFTEVYLFDATTSSYTPREKWKWMNMMICTRSSLLKHLGRQNDTWQHLDIDQATGTPLMPNRTLPKYYTYSIKGSIPYYGNHQIRYVRSHVHGYGYRNTRIITFYLLSSMLLLLIVQLLKPIISPNSYQIFAIEFIDDLSWTPLAYFHHWQEVVHGK